MKNRGSATPTLVGGEMLFWSSGAAESTRGGLTARLVAHAVPVRSRVLLVGPEDQPLIDELLDRGADLTVLVRAYADGVEVLRRNTDHREVHVVVGNIARLPIGDGFDAVIALAGLDRVCSAEGEDLGWGEVYDVLRSALRPEGVLLLAVDNPIGLHHMVRLSPWYANSDNASWRLPGVTDPGRPQHLDALRARLADDGLRVEAAYAAYPAPERPTALVDAAVLDAPGDTVGAIEAVIADACANGYADDELLRDPWPLATSALHAGAAATLAPAWWICARASAAASSLLLPVVLVEDDPMEIVAEGSTWVRRPAHTAPIGLVPAPAQAARPEGAERVPPGRLLREVLVDGCLRRDLPALRRILTGYADWLFANASEQGELPQELVNATPDNVVLDGDAYALLNPHRSAAASSGAADDVLAGGLRRFAVELNTIGYAHPWPTTVGVDSLAVVLGGMAGRDLAATLARLADDAWTLPEAVATPGSYQRLRETNHRQEEEITRLTARLAWSEKILSSREWHLSRAEKTLSLLSGSWAYKLLMLALVPLRWGKRQVIRVLRALRGGEDG